MEKFLTYKDDKSGKFWSIETSGKSFTATYGKQAQATHHEPKILGSEEKFLTEPDAGGTRAQKRGASSLKTYPHHPDESVFQVNLKAASERLVPHDAITPALLAERSEIFFPLNAKWALDCGCYAYALERDRQTVLGFFRESSRSFARALDARAPINLHEVILQLSIALILRDEAQARALRALPRARYTNPDMEFHEIMFVAGEVQAELALGDEASAARRLEPGLQALAGKKVPRAARDVAEPSLRIEKALVDRDPQALEAAFQARTASYARRFSNPRIRNLPEGALDVWGLGLARLALDRGLALRVESPYLPLDLLTS